MKYLKWIAQLSVTALLCVAPLLAKPDFVLDPKDQEVVTPKNTFSAREAKEALGKGSCTIKGVAFNRQKSGFLQKKHEKQYLPKGGKIYLFPYTPYTQEVVKFFKKYTPKEVEYSMATLRAETMLKAVAGEGIPQLLPLKRLELDPQFPKIWKGAMVGDGGQFTFEGLKPGTYYLQATKYTVARHHKWDEQVGEDVEELYWSDGSVSTNSYPVWVTREDTTYRVVELVKIVDLKEDGQVLEIELNQDWDDFKPR